MIVSARGKFISARITEFMRSYQTPATRGADKRPFFTFTGILSATSATVAWYERRLKVKFHSSVCHRDNDAPIARRLRAALRHPRPDDGGERLLLALRNFNLRGLGDACLIGPCNRQEVASLARGQQAYRNRRRYAKMMRDFIGRRNIA
jgi:hypothetical protein